MRGGTVQGFIDGKAIPLTRFLFRAVSRDGQWVGGDDYRSSFDKDPKVYAQGLNGEFEAAIMLHGLPYSIKKGMKHIYQLIERARSGNHNAIPRIHWWYVQFAPVLRGPGGIAEMLVCALCQYHNVELPAWKLGIIPSLEVLLEPDEEKFCTNYHKLFECDNDKLRQFFAQKEDALTS